MSRRALVVEDDPDDRELLMLAFREAGEHIDLGFAVDGSDALEQLSEAADAGRLPDLVVLDLNLPRLSGRDVLREVRRDPRLRDLKVAIMTTSWAASDRQCCEALGVEDYLVKPPSFRDLLSAVEKRLIPLVVDRP